MNLKSLKVSTALVALLVSAPTFASHTLIDDTAKSTPKKLNKHATKSKQTPVLNSGPTGLGLPTTGARPSYKHAKLPMVAPELALRDDVDSDEEEVVKAPKKAETKKKAPAKKEPAKKVTSKSSSSSDDSSSESSDSDSTQERKKQQQKKDVAKLLSAGEKKDKSLVSSTSTKPLTAYEKQLHDLLASQQEQRVAAIKKQEVAEEVSETKIQLTESKNLSQKETTAPKKLKTKAPVQTKSEPLVSSTSTQPLTAYEKQLQALLVSQQEQREEAQKQEVAKKVSETKIQLTESKDLSQKETKAPVKLKTKAPVQTKSEPLVSSTSTQPLTAYEKQLQALLSSQQEQRVEAKKQEVAKTAQESKSETKAPSQTTVQKPTEKAPAKVLTSDQAADVRANLTRAGFSEKQIAEAIAALTKK
jgi:hypothetical protein